MKKGLFVASTLIFVFVACLNYRCWAADEESLGQQAEQADKLREAVTHYIAALQSSPEGSTKDQQLREKIIKLVHKLTPPPAVPEEAEQYLARGRAAFKGATSNKDYADAINEFNKALRIVPWLAEGYYNLGVAQDKAGRYQDAMRSLKLYLMAAPNAPDVKEVKSLLFEIEYRQEKAQKEISTKRQAEERERQRLAEQKGLAEKLKGQWTVGRGYRNTWGTACKYSLPDPGHLFSIDVRGDQIQIYLVKSSFTNCVTNIRFPRYPLNLLKFRGTIQDGQITGTCYVHTYTQQAPNDVRDLKESDYYVSRSSSCKAEILWDGTGSSFTMSPNLMVQFGALPSNPYPLEWERE